MKNEILVLVALVWALFLLGCITEDSSDLNVSMNLDQNTVEVNADLPIVCSNIDCFIDASKDCSKATWASEYGTSFEIKGLQDSKCIIYRSAPMDDECPFEIVDLTAMLERWKQQDYSTNDWQTCSQQWKVLPASD